MEIFVESRGFDQQHGYNWVNEHEKIVEEPKIVEKFTVLLQKESPSLLIARENDQLLLLVTGIKSKRRDYQNRINRISVAWIGTNQEEAQLRSLAVRTLSNFIKKDTFINDIEKLIKDEGENGFTVDFDELKNPVSQINVKSEPFINDEPSIHKKDDQRIQVLADELEQYCLPPTTKQGALVVVTGIKKRETLQNDNVWRGLGNLVDEPGGQPEEGDNFREEDGANDKKNDSKRIEGEVRRSKAKSSGMVQGKVQRIIVPVLAVFLCISLSVNIWLYAQSNQQTQKIKAQNEKIESLNQQIQTLTVERDNVQKPLKTQ